jgi:hypothetical protein
MRAVSCGRRHFYVLGLSILVADSMLSTSIGGKRIATHLGRSMKSPCLSLTERLLLREDEGH